MLFDPTLINTPQHQDTLIQLNLTPQDTTNLLELAAQVLERTSFPTPLHSLPITPTITNNDDDIGIHYECPIPANSTLACSLTNSLINARIQLTHLDDPLAGTGLSFSFVPTLPA